MVTNPNTLATPSKNNKNISSRVITYLRVVKKGNEDTLSLDNKEIETHSSRVYLSSANNIKASKIQTKRIQNREASVLAQTQSRA